MIVTNPFRPGSWTRAQIENLTGGWWVLFVTGVLSVVAGGIIILTKWSVSDLAFVVGVVLVFRGFFTLFSFPVDGSIRAWSIVYGLIEIGVGIAVWAWPEPTLLVIAAFIGWLLLFRGVMTITGSLAARGVMPAWGLVLAVGILEVLVSFYLLSRPGLTLVATILAIGLVLLFYGVVEIIVAFEVKNLPQQLDELTEAPDGASNSGRLEGATRQAVR
jgi:uncharacterized membrane protein HdeD (DUF308 family)